MVHWLDVVLLVGQFLFGMTGILLLLSWIPIHHPSSVLYKRIWSWKQAEPPDKLMSILRLDRYELLRSERAILLAGCGLEVSVLTYCVMRVLLLSFSWVVLLGLLLVTGYSGGEASMLVVSLAVLLMLMIAVLQWDRYFLKMYRELRAVAITREIYTISHQLLYFEDSSLHIHNKLRRCLPYSKLLRRDMETLLAEWYQDPARALQAFKERIGTAEGISFVETIDALRQQHNNGFYELLRTHLRDYKERLELAKESRKETSSYVLFVVAGIPILFTFQVFLYPWVQEVNKLMSLMNN